MYPVDDQDKVVELGVPQSDVGAPEPIVLCNEFKILLAYDVHYTWPTTLREPVALIEFALYESLMFGMPNDEALNGHPLYSRGLHRYGAFQIKNSSWIRQLEKMNSIHPYHDPESFKRYKHYIFAFHDSTFECVAEGLSVSEHEGPLAGLLPIMQTRLQK